MKKSMSKAIEKIKNKKGESFVESICSIVIFTILIVSVMMIVNVAVQIVKSSFEKENLHQQTINRIIAGDASLIQTTADARITLDGETFTLPIKLYNENGVISFEPNR